jgi:hypothetical protein
VTRVERAILAFLFVVIMLLVITIVIRDAHIPTWGKGLLPESVPVVGVWFDGDGEPYSVVCIALRGAIYEYTYSTTTQQVTKPVYWTEVPK